MNKTININLGGVFFHIDEIAYQKLKSYLDAIRRSLSDDPQGRDEIINDIESRIGELLAVKVKDVRQVINSGDIDEVIEVMGKPEDYMVDDDMFSDEQYRTYKSRSKKLYRDGSDRFLGGVSSGIAHYLNVDVIWIRLGWLVAAFGFGFGFIIYPLLWILLPEATTTAEKLEMEGEPVTISNIEKKIRDEISQASVKVKEGIEDVSEKVKNADYSNYRQKAKSGSQDFIDTLGKIITTLFMIVGKFIGVLLIIISVSIILSLLISMFTIGSLDFISDDWFLHNRFFMNNSGLPVWSISLLTFVLVGIPFFFLFALGLRILSNNTKTVSKTAKLSLLGIWLVALLTTIFFGTRQYMQTAYDGSVTAKQELVLIEGDTLSVGIGGDGGLTDKALLSRHWGKEIVLTDQDEEMVYSNNIRVNVHRSEDESAYVKVRKRSQGPSRKDARDNADLIRHEVVFEDKQVRIDGYFLSGLDTQFMEQKLYVDLYLPLDQVIYFDNSSETYLYEVDNVQNVYDHDMIDHHFQMTKEGLSCMDCDDYEIREESDPESFNMKIDEKGVHIQISDQDDEQAEVKIDENGVSIRSRKDSI